MADQKITALTELTTPALSDLLAIVDDVAGTPTTKKIQLENLFAGLVPDAAGLKPASDGANAIQLQTSGGTVVLNIDTTNQRVGIGTDSPDELLHVAGTIKAEAAIKVVAADVGMEATRYTDTAGANTGMKFYRARGSEGSEAVVQDEDYIATIRFYGYSGAASDWVALADFSAVVDGTPDSGGDATDMPGALLFRTTKEGVGGPTERLRIANNGNIGIGTASPNSLLELALSTENLEIVDAGSAGATEQDWIEVEVGGNTGYIRVFAAK